MPPPFPSAGRYRPAPFPHLQRFCSCVVLARPIAAIPLRGVSAPVALSSLNLIGVFGCSAAKLAQLLPPAGPCLKDVPGANLLLAALVRCLASRSPLRIRSLVFPYAARNRSLASFINCLHVSPSPMPLRSTLSSNFFAAVSIFVASLLAPCSFRIPCFDFRASYSNIARLRILSFLCDL